MNAWVIGKLHGWVLAKKEEKYFILTIFSISAKFSLDDPKIILRYPILDFRIVSLPLMVYVLRQMFLSFP